MSYEENTNKRSTDTQVTGATDLRAYSFGVTKDSKRDAGEIQRLSQTIPEF